MDLGEKAEMSAIIKIIMGEIHDKPTGMMFGQIKRMHNEGLSNHQIRVGLELMIAKIGLNKRSGLKKVPDYIGDAMRDEREAALVSKNRVTVNEYKQIVIPFKRDFKYRNKKLKELN